LAKGGTAILARAGINALGTQASQIVHNGYFDEGVYPSGGELAAAAGLGATTSYGGELADAFVSQAVRAISGNQAAGQVAGSVSYNLVRNFGSSYYVNKGLNFIDWAAEGGSVAK
jgi:hypothetical protein